MNTKFPRIGPARPLRCLFLLLLSLPAAAPAATWNVTTTADEADGSCFDGDCSLRDAVAAAVDGDTIAVPAGDYLLAIGQIQLTRDVSIAGAGARATVLRGNGSARHFAVAAAAAAELSGLTLTGGRANFGGAISNDGELTLRGVAVVGNQADFAGGINSEGQLAIYDSTIAGNNANSVGGVYANTRPLLLVNSTISGNLANLLAGGVAAFGPATIEHSTIAFNTVTRTVSWQGGGIFFVGETSIRASLLDRNFPANCDSIAPEEAVANLDSDASCLLPDGNLIGVASQLETLRNNGGGTDTHALPPASPAVDYVSGCTKPADQRGISRPQGAACDAGAFELERGAAATTLCSGEDFSAGLGGLSFSPVGDADQGGAAAAGGRAQLTSDGSSFYHGSDNGGFLHRPVSGDFRAEVTLEAFPVDAGGGYRRSGLTVRTGTGANDPRVYVEFLPHHPSYGRSALMFDYRGTDGVARELASTQLGLSLPLHLAIDRRGNRFTVWYSADGSNWTRPAGAAGGSVSIAMPAAVEIGMMQASYDQAVTLTSEFDGFAVCQPNPEPLPPPPAPAACLPGQPLDLVYLLDASGSAPSAFPGGPTQLDAARQAIARLNDLIAAGLPGSRAALISFQGGPAPAYATGAGATVRSPLTTDLAAVESAAAAISPAAINPTTSSPLSHGLAAARELLENSAHPAARPVVVLLGDGFVNVDAAGNGPNHYRNAELAALSIIDGPRYRTVGETGWLGNWNGPIATWDGEALANAMAQGLYLKQRLPGATLSTLGLHGAGLYRMDLLGFLADYGGGSYREATDPATLEAAALAIYAGLACPLP